MTTDMIFDDGAGEDDASNEVTISINGPNEHGQVWFQIQHMDGEAACFFTKERWEAVKAMIDTSFASDQGKNQS